MPRFGYFPAVSRYPAASPQLFGISEQLTAPKKMWRKMSEIVRATPGTVATMDALKFCPALPPMLILVS